MKNDNHGLSLVELIVVLAIMSVLIGVGTLGLHYFSTRPAKQLAYNLDTAIKNGRITALAKESGGYELKVHYDPVEKSYYVIETIEGVVYTKNIGGKGVEVKYKLKGMSDPITIDGNDMIVKFNRSTGGIDMSGDYVEYIDITKSSKKYTLTIYKLTGKVVLKEL